MELNVLTTWVVLVILLFMYVLCFFQLNPNWLVSNLKEMFLGAHEFELVWTTKTFHDIERVLGSFLVGENFSISQYPTFKLLRITIVGKNKVSTSTLLGTNISHLGKGKSSTQIVPAYTGEMWSVPWRVFHDPKWLSAPSFRCCSWSLIPNCFDVDFS